MDWQAVVRELVDVHGMSQSAIGRVVGCSQVHAGDIYHGNVSDPAYSLGSALLRLLERERRKARRKAAGQALPQSVTKTEPGKP